MEVTVKAFLQKANGDREVRRVSLPQQPGGAMFKSLFGKIATTFPDLKGRNFSITWEDPDGDFVLMSSEEELRDALAQNSSGPLKVFISVGEGQAVGIDQTMEEEMTPGSDPGSKVTKVRHDREMPRPFHPGMFGRRCGKRGRVPYHRPHGPPNGPHGASQGPHHGPYDGPHQGPHHEPHHGPHGPWMKMRGPPAGPFGPVFGMCPWPQADHQSEGCDRRGWKKALRESVPVSHRRWAKTYIHTWRRDNLKNATTTTSGSEQERKTKCPSKEEAGVPEAYVVWLDMMLPKFHKRWEIEMTTGQDGKDLDQDDGDDSLATLKSSVPVEFRKWTWWYLAKRYGKRSEPEFRCGSPVRKGQPGACGKAGKHGMMGKCGRKARTGGAKLHHVASQVPKQTRSWAKQFILSWRLEHQIPTTKPPHMSDSENEVVSAQDVAAPEDYGKWLLKFLPRWHMWRGQVDASKVNVPAGRMGEFKDTVPIEFRRWVKCYLYKHYNQAKGHAEAGDENRYRRWLQIFKKKWLQQQGSGSDVDPLCMTSSEDETAGLTSDPDTDMEMDSSFKRLRLEGKDAEKNVHFAVATEWDIFQGNESDSDTDMMPFGKKPGNPQFRHFAKNQLYDWDGQAPTEGVDDITELPPPMYRWLCRMMFKMQKKKMRQEMKAAKQQMKAARREMKAAAKAQSLNFIFKTHETEF